MNVLPLTLEHAPHLHELYRATPSYFALLGSPVPSLHEVTRDVETALYDARRRLELLYHEGQLIGSLDYKLNYPHDGDVTINLLLIRGDRQSSGLGAQVVRDLERRLPQGQRLLASVLGDNRRAVKFWERLGFVFATDARPVMTWYAKPLPAALSESG
ncbi:N-acetyltransferase [Deinococcus irradiatisoli]|uniref:N-acetyltransferase n=1 Tax=Deinococcus irradiatisoli TaxID=2202254 RepID=A0A2Z3JKK4_9DEIO|nr:GNAT family N-acetyltransferase [Deinococcus irradiatisoli]AWN21824.1 N-acetyltransferase [Deinococcus irradiatisoli]